MDDDLRYRAQAEMDEYFNELVPAELTEQRIGSLALELRQVSAAFSAGSAAQAEANRILHITLIYLNRALERQDIDARLRLDILSTLCWSKREESLNLLPESLRDELSEDWLPQEELLLFWHHRSSALDAVTLARMLTWWTVANLVSNAVHLAAGEAGGALRDLLAALGADAEALGRDLRMN